MRSIANHVRPDRQGETSHLLSSSVFSTSYGCLYFSFSIALLFSATFKSKIERLARDILTDPVRIVQGEVGEVNDAISKAYLPFFTIF